MTTDNVRMVLPPPTTGMMSAPADEEIQSAVPVATRPVATDGARELTSLINNAEGGCVP